jgi:hypothetical protein
VLSAGFLLALVSASIAGLHDNAAESRHLTNVPQFQTLASSPIIELQGSWSHLPGTDLGANFDHSSPVIADLDGPGQRPTAAFVSTNDGCVHAFVYNGTSTLGSLPGFPACVGTYMGSSPAIGDLDKNGVSEIVVGAGKLYQPGDPDQWRQDNGGIWIFWNGDTNNRSHYQVKEGVFATPAIGDIDGDGTNEIVFGDFAMWVRALHWNGQLKWATFIADTVWSSPALTKIPGQNNLATVIGTDLGGGNPEGHLGCPQYYGGYLVRGFLLALDPNGNPIPGFPKCMDTPIWSSPAIGDLNKDGRADAVFGTNNYQENGQNVGGAQRIHAIDLWSSFQGGTWVDDKSISYLPGWPAYVSSSNARIFASPALGDIDGDGYDEVAVADIRQCGWDPPNVWNCGKMSIYNSSGVRVADQDGGDPGAIQSYPFTGSPVIADVLGDSRPEALFGGGDAHIHAIDATWQVQRTYYAWNVPFSPYGRQFRNSAAVGDLTGDGKSEIFIASGTHEDPARGAAWLLAPAKSNPSWPAPWPQFKRDAQRQSNKFSPLVYTLQATPGDNKVRLQWFTTGTPAAATKVLRKVAPSCPTTPMDGVLVYQGNGGTVTDMGVVNGTTYCYGAFFDDGSFEFASSAFATATPLPPPPPPSNLVVREEDGQILLFWNYSTAGNFTGVRIVRKPGTTPPTNPSDGSVVFDGVARSYVDYGLSNGSPYSYALFSHNGIPDYSAPTTAAARIPNPHTGLPYAFFVAEGYTGNPGFASVQYLTLGNNEAVDASVVMTFYPQGSAPVEYPTVVPKKSRRTVVSNSIVGPGKSVAVRVAVSSGPGVLLERPMYFAGNPGTGSAVADGHNAIGKQSPQTEWYFAEGYTGAGFVEYLTLLNPSAEGPAQVRLDFAFNGGLPPSSMVVSIAPQSRSTVNVNSVVGGDKEVSVKATVTSGPGIVAERSMYFVADPALGATVRGGHAKPGAEAPASEWYFAEGYTGAGFVEYLTFQNPSSLPSQADVEFNFNAGIPSMTRQFPISPNSRFTVRVNDVVGPGREVSVKVTVPGGMPPLVVERPMYFASDPALGAVVAAGHNAPGTRGPSYSWIFSEGYTGGGFVEYLTVQNPSITETSNVRFEYVFNDGAPPVVIDRTIPPSTRATFNVNSDVGAWREVSALLQVTSGSPVVVERPMYFVADPALGSVVRGGTVAFGYAP